MDTTLRDGEQTSGVSFVPHEKLMIARMLLEDLKVDRIEVASARVSDGELNAVRMICDWAARHDLLSRVEVLGFVDGGVSADWIHQAGGRVINLLTKGSEKHCRYQLKRHLKSMPVTFCRLWNMPIRWGWKSMSIWKTGVTASRIRLNMSLDLSIG